MTNDELINLAKRLPYSYSSIKELHDKLPEIYQKEEYITHAFNCRSPYAFVEFLSRILQPEINMSNEILQLSKLTAKPTLYSRWRSFWWGIGYSLGIVK